jgi:phytoene synthase
MPDLHTTHDRIFRASSKTFYTASRFFPSAIRADVATLYAFVRIADDFVDSVPQQADAYYAWKDAYRAAKAGTPASDIDPVITAYVDLERRYGFPPAWTQAFFASMEMDLHGMQYETIDDTLRYIHGSAEVIGYMMARLMQVPEEAYSAAQLLGRAFQYMNFIRDIAEDEALGRVYLPRDIRARHGLAELTRVTAQAHPDAFTALVRDEIMRYRGWMREARSGFSYIPRRYRIPVAAAADSFDDIVNRIWDRPLRVYEGKVARSRLGIMRAAAYHALNSL